MLCANAAPLGAAAAMAATTARCDSTVAGAVHPCCSATRDRSIRHAAGARNRTRALMTQTLVPVPASNEEHGSAVSNSSNNGAAGDDGTGRIDLFAGANVTPKSPTIRSAGIRGPRVGNLVRGTVILASRKRAGSVDETSQVVDRRVFVVPESVRRVAKSGLQVALHILGDSEQSRGGDEALPLESVDRLQAKVLHTLERNVKPVRDSNGQVVEDLVSTVIRRDKWIVQWPLEANLAHEAILWHCGWHTVGRCDHLW